MKVTRVLLVIALTLTSTSGFACRPRTTDVAARSDEQQTTAPPHANMVAAQPLLRVASSFHLKFSQICFQKGLDLEYRGPLSRKWVEGVLPPFDDYDRWRVKCYRSPQGEIVLGLKEDGNLNSLLKSGYSQEYLFDVRMENFQAGQNTIEVQLGRNTIEIQVSAIRDRHTVDERIPELGSSIREFLEQLGEPMLGDRVFGISWDP